MSEQPEQEDVGQGDGGSTAADSIEALQRELASAREEAAANYDKYLRARADMDNYKRRADQRHADEVKRSKKELLQKLLAVKDNMERALLYGESSQSNGEGIMEGVRLTQYQLDQLLAQEGVQPIETEGRPFDPHTDEAIQSVDNPDVPDHQVIQEVRRGYTLGDEVLRPAQVIVSVHGE